jgi:hypothetical protein
MGFCPISYQKTKTTMNKRPIIFIIATLLSTGIGISRIRWRIP